MYAHTSTTFPALIFTKLINSRQHYVQISYTEFHKNRTINGKGMDRNSFTLPSKVWRSLYRFWRNFTHVVTDLIHVGWKILKIRGKSLNTTPLTKVCPFNVTIFTKLTTAQRHCAGNFYSEFYPYWSENIASVRRNPFYALSKVRVRVTWAVLQETQGWSITFL
jgi:hypothetical protein